MSIIRKAFKIFNGSVWDEYHLKTDSKQVVHTKKDGTDTTVEEQLNSLNSTLNIKKLLDTNDNLGISLFNDSIKMVKMSKVIVPSADNHIKVTDITEISNWLGIAESKLRFQNLIITSSNGDLDANAANLYSPIVQNRIIWQYTDRNTKGIPMRVNIGIIYFNV